ncbi:alkane 1-monooxygenase [Pseudohalocynthiibacter aestuariivivens]|jgi:alkane 1-monooxygenase|uniref:Alkane 1-monooxygenase n=1 Tax=Pseudohalocynthiibacter aestuariivivens TaxID=1591409 RepID=A0ABV5JDV9_9RHOB|nr:MULTISPECIES: alkane 1-monooxygenase [Pseudohalocynthiibacter]MBS9718035.1 alkane 1-monooxygenase [Pseudohalocynthiibacter aestuariivivens]MCK0103207.1 alkane 1-monooxygenase [Pseudohalocynthiibacter sp. F2068]
MIPAAQVAKLQNALPFWLSLGMVPLTYLGAVFGGWALILQPFYGLCLFSILDKLTGLNLENPDVETDEADLFWYRLITLLWFPIQLCVVFGTIWWVTHTDHLALWEKIVLFYGVGMLSGGIGITYSHELMHQKNNLERWLGDLLLAMVLYSHFRSEHLQVHHSYVATPRDPVTARYNEGFHKFFLRVLRQCLRSAWNAEKAMLARKGKGAFDRSNPFFRYGTLQAAMLVLAYLIGGWGGLALFIYQASVAVWFLELTNYVEHYGLTRKHLGDGKYEHVKPRHSWNAAHKTTNWLLINLQRHSDHHYKPNRRFPLLQNYSEAEAPQLPYGYPVMTAVAMVPPLWRRMMNPRVRRWRSMYYPEITDWSAYKTASNPMPR